MAIVIHIECNDLMEMDGVVHKLREMLGVNAPQGAADDGDDDDQVEDADEVDAAPAPAAEKPKRTRRTKAEIEAEKAAAAPEPKPVSPPPPPPAAKADVEETAEIKDARQKLRASIAAIMDKGVSSEQIREDIFKKVGVDKIPQMTAEQLAQANSIADALKGEKADPLFG